MVHFHHTTVANATVVCTQGLESVALVASMLIVIGVHWPCVRRHTSRVRQHCCGQGQWCKVQESSATGVWGRTSQVRRHGQHSDGQEKNSYNSPCYSVAQPWLHHDGLMGKGGVRLRFGLKLWMARPAHQRNVCTERLQGLGQPRSEQATAINIEPYLVGFLRTAPRAGLGSPASHTGCDWWLPPRDAGVSHFADVGGSACCATVFTTSTLQFLGQ